MKKSIVKNLIFMVVAICLISFASVAFPGEKAVETVKGEIMSMDTLTGLVTIKDEAGKIMDLQLGPEKLKDLKQGDKVTVETHGGKLKSIMKHK